MVTMIVAVSLGSLGASTPQTLSDDETILAQLADADYAVRQQASEQLLVDEDLDEPTLQRLYAAARLGEQKHRLLDVARHQALRRMRLESFPDQGNGAIGIRHEAFASDQYPELNQAGLIVVETFPGFPGNALLRRGDLILAIDNQRFATELSPDQVANRFIRMVQEHQSGEVIRLSVRRQGQVKTVALRLANLLALRTMYKDTQKLQQPFLDRWRAIHRRLVAASESRVQVPIGESPQTQQPQ